MNNEKSLGASLEAWEQLAKDRNISTYDLLAAFSIGTLVDLKINNASEYSRLEQEHEAHEKQRLEKLADRGPAKA